MEEQHGRHPDAVVGPQGGAPGPDPLAVDLDRDLDECQVMVRAAARACAEGIASVTLVGDRERAVSALRAASSVSTSIHPLPASAQLRCRKTPEQRQQNQPPLARKRRLSANQAEL